MNQDKFISLLSKKLSGEISSDDKKLLEQVMDSDHQYKRIAEEFEQYLKEKNISIPATAPVDKIWNSIALAENAGFTEKFDYSSRQKIYFNSPFLKVAALIILFFGASLYGYHLLNLNRPDLITIASINEKTFKMLDDGTKIWLNKKSTIRYNEDFGQRKREIFLDGEAYFDVIKNKAVPLVIHARNINIEVKGTAFNVNAYQENDKIQVALVRGLIQITNKLNSAHNVLLKPNEKLIVSTHTAGSEDFVVLPLASQTLLSETRWIADTLVFRKEKLKNLALRLEKKYDLKIEVKSEQLKEKRFSGAFTTESIHQALEALKLSYPLTYTINDRLVVIKD